MDIVLDGLVQSTKAVMTRVELGGTLFLVAVIGMLQTSRGEEDKRSSYATCLPEASLFLRHPHIGRADWIRAYSPLCVDE
ncbi:MAG: hypothetical protein AVDCRST_MAG55-301 [uncultured Rubrobacteraceae bacterium]|uniref:Uncharacterized protein n=1 Tax=uncultured Rubrobacteraceae bacterium TaxID=349277 RepID=A0A6J4NXR5_9ACTN|nr:MAG: hypothetical protein AVDCRST_MAG55-301 [uncultured Rubrobacteraceae bacterium]